MSEILDRNALEALALKTANERYGGYSFFFIFGSSYFGTANAKSDVDMIIVFERPVTAFHEKYLYEGQLFDVHVFDAESLNAVIHRARRGGGSVVMVDIIMAAVALPSATRTSELLKLAAQRVKETKPITEEPSEIRNYLTALIDDIEHVTDPDELMNMSVELFQAISTAILQFNGAAGQRKHHAVNAFKTANPEFFAKLSNGMREVVYGNKGLILECAQDLLTQLGGPLRAGYKRILPDAGRLPLPLN